MPNTLTFDSVINAPNMAKARIGRALFDQDTSIALIEVILSNANGGMLYRADPFVLQIGNGLAAAVVSNPASSSLADIVVTVTVGGAGVATAFNTVFAAYGGADRRGALLTAMKGISGIVQATPGTPAALIGTTIPLLPSGTVS